MIRLEFTEKEIESLNYERFHHPHPRVQRKMEVLYLKSQGIPHQEICRLTRVSAATLCTYLHSYQEGGIEGLKTVKFYRPQSELRAHTQSLEAYFLKHPPHSVKEAGAIIEELTGIKRRPTQVRQFLDHLGLKRRKVGVIPAKADLQQQEDFKKKALEPRLDEAKAGKRAVFFVDAAHFVLSAYLGFLWCVTRLFIKAPSGRQRFNVLAALNAITHEILTVTNETYITATSVCELLRQIASLKIALPITVVLDNARYQRCALVQGVAHSLGIELLFLPSYSPNLNLIERFWKFIKKQCLYSKYYTDFSTFQTTIYQCIMTAHQRYQKELDSLLALRFQTFKL